MKSVKTQNGDVVGDVGARLSAQVSYLFTNLFSRPEVAIVILTAAILTASNVLSDGQADVYDGVVAKLDNNTSTAGIATFLEKYKLDVITAVWYAGIYGAVPGTSKSYVVIIAAIDVLGLDFTVLQGAFMAIATYVFFTVKDKQIRTLAILVSAGYTYFSYK